MQFMQISVATNTVGLALEEQRREQRSELRLQPSDYGIPCSSGHQFKRCS
jgi:hypothetical protein